MIRFPINTSFARLPAASWMNGVGAFTFLCWTRFDTVDTARHQRQFKHKGATNQLSLRKTATTNKFYASTTVGGALVTASGGSAVIAGTLYHVAMVWEKNTASGLRLYVDGILVSSTNTTTQTVDYDSGDPNSVLYFATDNGSNDIGLSDLESAIFWPGTALNLVEIDAIRLGGWPALTAVPRPAAHYLFDGRLLTKILDVSGNGRHIGSSDILGSPSDQGMQGRWERDPGTGFYLHSPAAGAPPGPPAPDPWTKYPTTHAHPATEVVLSGLTPGVTYEMYLTALDEAGNESAESAVVSAVARESLIVHTEKRVFLGHAA